MGSLVALALSGCALVPVVTKQASHPERSAMHRSPAIDAPVAILRDDLGVPHVRASDERGAWFGLGYAHGQDRLFQADGTRRFAFGGLSELFGERTVDLDLFMAGLDLRSRAEEAYQRADPETRAALDAYASGLNAAAADLDPLPVEYRVLGVQFSPWQPEDALALVYTNAWMLSATLPQELSALALADRVDAEALSDLLRTEEGVDPVEEYWPELAAGLDHGALVPGLAALVGQLPAEPEASNNWAIAPERSADGHAILANDPHLRQRVPSLWYFAELRGGDLHVAGATLPGSPFVVIGHNGALAWGATNLMADDVDLAVVERVGERGYRLAGAERQLRQQVVRVSVRGGEEAERSTWWTKIGPVVSELEGQQLLVLQWKALFVEDRSADLFYGLDRSGSVAEALELARLPSAVSQHLAMADVHGEIALARVTSLPNRMAHRGSLPYPASDPGQGWSGWLEPLPPATKPADGLLWSANYRPDVERADEISLRYAPPWRHRRVGQLLHKTELHDVESVQRIQLDRLDLHAQRRIPDLLALSTPTRPAASRCAGLLRDWDGRAEPWSVGATVFYAVEREILRLSLADALGEDFGLYAPLARPVDALLGGRYDRWIDSPGEIVDEALATACEDLEEELGEDSSAWTWGSRHTLQLQHPFGSNWPLRGWNLPLTPYGGSGNTVNAAGISSSGWQTTGMASLRLIVPMSDPAKARFAYPGGQSGHPGESHYDDLFAPYLEGSTQPLWFAEEDVIAHAHEATVLQPR